VRPPDDSGRRPAEEMDVARAIWQHALTTANNVCMLRSEAINADDGSLEACDALSEAAAEIRKYLKEDDAYLKSVLSIALLSSRPLPNQTKETTMLTDEQIKHMVNRFLAWRLPEHFNPDCGIHFDA